MEVKKLLYKLKKNEFFNGLTVNEIEKLLLDIRYELKKYEKGKIIANEEEECKSLAFVIEGIVEIQRIYLSGKQLSLKRVIEGEVFGEALVFSKQSKYPATICAFSECKILYISKSDILKICNNNQVVLSNFMCALSDKIFMLNSKIKNISFQSVRHKVVNYILEQAKLQNSNIINLNESKEEIAKLLGIPRPSLSRQLIKFRDLNYIEFNRNIINILNILALEEELLD